MTLLFDSSARSAALADRYGYGEWLVGRFLRYVPEVERFMEKMEQPPAQYIRVNTLKTARGDLERRLVAKGFGLEPTALSEVLKVTRAPMATGATNEYLLGHYYIQDLSSCMAVEALDAQKGQSVLDMAAAPGGKTTHIAQRMQNTGSIIALEPNQKRARSMSFNLDRLGVANTCILHADALATAKDLGNNNIEFDRVLLDAPCSCEGVIARDKTRKTSHSPEDVDYCAGRQEKMLEAAIGACQSGGIVVYSTCSFAPEENEVIVDRMVRKFGVSVEPMPHGSEGLACFGNMEFEKSVRNARRFYPHIHDTTGFFVARMRVP
ncbi:NOL1/NOP2/sun family putative RNA methylase [Nitrososphaera viennensis]|uniref:RsmB/NOP family class I SAM-dependent RNA methyltransferase n=2 Tax=Nitrososphaera viennensis TaxID=1034015 RepID=A0A977IEJ9_9ARCH|nr:RsmB/NOP family class I SAM-dependent RNA methyltransferase [Nitrososphaera viennensis]AIC14330.1 putative NOL1/NOP2/sun family putative RNA methylase [Nitrososphaera viennensis EN76]UVS69322.1 RsmB/NOP family class I SAM-dependent RNA methyltransferase [Nitrososphaera viennensis]